MARRLIAAAWLAGTWCAAEAGSVLHTVQHGAEVALAELELPEAEGGTLRFAACRGCEARSVAVPSGTRYQVNGRLVTFAELAAAVEAASASVDILERSLAGLYFDAASRRLEGIALVAPLTRARPAAPAASRQPD